MGRELRMVPPNWQHPKYTSDDAPRSTMIGQYKPLMEGYADAIKDFAADIESKGLPEAIEYHGGGPLRESFVDYGDQHPTWFQIYETVSEGTPVTPPFATKQELIDYLVTYGDFWDQLRGDGPYSHLAAENMVNSGYAPSGIVLNGVFYDSKQSLEHTK